MSRCLLHIRRLDAFREWLESEGIPSRPGAGEYQVLQVRHNGYWLSVFERHDMPEHYSTDRRLDGLIRRFIRESRS